MNNSKSFYLPVLLIFVVWSCANHTEPADEAAEIPPVKDPTLWGTWEMEAIHWITKDTTYTIAEAQPGYLMINPSSYSIMWIPTQQPRTPFEILSKPTDEEFKSGFQSVVFNGGTYQLTDSTLTTTALIAKVPGFEGGKQFYRYKIDGDKLEITMFDETYPDGSKPEWFGSYETKFVMSRFE